jgi:FtsP/CotA-like multicopper oxidase with cupredoxin domain
MDGRKMSKKWVFLLVLTVAALFVGASQLWAAQAKSASSAAPETVASFDAQMSRVITSSQRQAAAAKLAALRKTANGTMRTNGVVSALATLTPNATPDYYNVANYANSPLPTLDASGKPISGTGIRKFVDSLPGLGAANANALGQYIPIAVPDTTSYPASGATPAADYYIIALVRFSEQLSSDLPATTLQGYVQIETPANASHSIHYALKYPDGSAITSGGVPLYGVTKPQYDGPTIIANRNRPVRVKFMNKLPIGSGGNLFLPVDTSIMGAGMGPNGGSYTQNRATLHLHGGATPWISDGTPHQWTTPAGENTTYTEGVSVYNVPDMDGGHEPTGTLTFYYTNQQSARLMFYHDHSYGITRLNVYAGEAAPYILNDPIEQDLVNGGQFKANGTTVTVAPSTIPTEEVPLVIQDKTFVPQDSQLAVEDPTWDKARWGGYGNLWLPHVYMPNQISGNDALGNELGGVNAYGRWDYNPWFYPPILPIAGTGSFGTPVPNPLYGQVGEPAQNPGMPSPTIVPESFMDTPIVNGTAYPYMKVGKKAYRFRILNACDDRTLNLQIYFAASNGQMWSAPATMTLVDGASGEVTMTAAAPHPGDPTWPSTWPTDGRAGGVPAPTSAGPSFIQIGNEAGFLPSATVLPNTPVGYEYFRRTITVLNVTNKTLFLGPAERADVIVDFSNVPDGSKLILYNDAPAPVPAFDTRLDYYTGDGDQTSSGGAPNTVAGYGPNTRTIMQFQVDSTIASQTAFSVPRLQSALQSAYAASQDKPIVPEPVYNSVFATSFPNTYVHVIDLTTTFKPFGSSTPTTFTLQEKAVVEGFDASYGRMNANLGGTLPNVGPTAGTAIPYDYIDPPTDIINNTIPGTQLGTLNDGTQIWRVDHQGVDTHAIHFHLFNVQVINRVAIDGQIFPPDPNELGWKETVRMNPGQDVIIALRPIVPVLPWKLPDSIRPLDPSIPLGATFVDQNGTTYTNTMTDFGWEYVWHCHLLGHEENDMMRPLDITVAPTAPTTLKATPSAASVSPQTVSLTWVNNATIPAATNFLIQRATNAAFTGTVVSMNASGAAVVSFTDATVAPSTTYYYRVRAEDAAGFSTWSNTATALTPALPLSPLLAPTGVTVTARTRTSIAIKWTHPAGGATWASLRVQFSQVTPAVWTTTRNFIASTLTYNWTALTMRNHRYWFRVLSVDAAGNTAASTAVSALTLP